MNQAVMDRLVLDLMISQPADHNGFFSVAGEAGKGGVDKKILRIDDNRAGR
jgi:hypothetical protein